MKELTNAESRAPNPGLLGSRSGPRYTGPRGEQVLPHSGGSPPQGSVLVSLRAVACAPRCSNGRTFRRLNSNA